MASRGNDRGRARAARASASGRNRTSSADFWALRAPNSAMLDENRSPDPLDGSTASAARVRSPSTPSDPAPARRPRPSGAPQRPSTQVDRRRRAYHERQDPVTRVAVEQHDDARQGGHGDGRQPGDTGERHRAYCARGLMSTLSPHLAIAYLRALSTDVRAVAIHGPGGELVAGEAAAGDVIRARDGDHEIAVSVGPHALPSLIVHDALQALQIVVRPPNTA